MAALTSIVLGAGAALGAAGAINTSLEQKKARKAQRRELERSRIKAKEAAALKATKQNDGADIKLGAVEDEEGTVTAAAQKGTAARKKRAGTGTGLGGGVSAARVGGL